MIDGKSVALVIPTIRENSFKDFVDRWTKVGLFSNIEEFIVMEDNPTRTFDFNVADPCHATHYSWEQIAEELGPDEWIIPRRSDTVRSFGYLKAWQTKCDLILTLDDDCYPPSAPVDGVEYNGVGFLKLHNDALSTRSRWFNTLTSVKPRGIPFYNTGKNQNVIVNHGLWTNVLDYDAPYQLANPVKEQFVFDNRVIPAGFYFPMCGMNVMWRRDATVLMYHLLMGQRMTMMTSVPETQSNGLLRLPFDRFGDIWCGILMKKVADLTGHLVTTGMPYIRHERASNPFTNLRKEANGIEVNEDLWEHIDRFNPHEDELFSFEYIYGELGKHVARFTDSYPKYKEHEQYFTLLGRAMQVWATLFKEGV